MQATTVKLHSLGYDQAKTYWIAALFVAGNVLLPQLCHLVPQGGVRWLPIYFFTLIAAYKYGWRAGMPDGRCLAFDQFGAVRHARRRYFAPYSVQIVAAGRRRGTDCCALPSRVAAAACGCGARLSGDRHSRRMGDDRIASRSLAGFPYRTAGHVAPDPRRLGLHALDAPPISRERLSGDPDSSDEYDLTAIQGGCTP